MVPLANAGLRQMASRSLQLILQGSPFYTTHKILRFMMYFKGPDNAKVVPFP